VRGVKRAHVAYNDYRPLDWRQHDDASGGFRLLETRQARNAAKRRRREART